MLRLRLRLIDFMDAIPIADAGARLTVHVMAGWKKRVHLPDVPRTGGGPRPRPPPDVVTVMEFDEQRAVILTADAVTDTLGRALLEVDAGEAFRSVSLLTLNDAPPDALQAQCSARADVYGLALPTAERFAGFDTPDAEHDLLLLADPARVIVGDTAARQSTLWFQLHAKPREGDVFVCSVKARMRGAVARRVRLTLRTLAPHAAVTTITRLQPSTLHDVELIVVPPQGSERVIARAAVRTFADNPRSLSLAFGSCHLPGSEQSLNRWHSLAAREDIDLAFLIGDQIYGDGIENLFPGNSWPERYERRYNQLWTYRPVRRVLRSRPIYMALDDHEVKDDWGTIPIEEEGREAAGLAAYKQFQHAHNPGGAGASVLEYGFQRGPASFYVTDSRTARGKESAFPVMGRAQFDRLVAWSRSPAVRASDLVFVVVPVPPAILPIAQLEKLAGMLAAPVGAAGGGLAGAVVGGIVGFIVGGPAGAVVGASVGAEIGAFAGAVGTKVYYEHLEDTIEDPDVRDAWTYDKNLSDLVRLLDVLFDLANDIGPDGRPGPRPRGVFILSGDYHFGAMHLVRSTRSGSGHDHRRNPALVQITSSPISKGAVDASMMLKLSSLVTSGSGEFKLDSKHYRSRFIGHLEQRNYGRVVFEQVGSARRYRIQLYVEGETDALAEMFELDLDANPVQMRNLLGEVLAARGKLTLLRVHDVGTAYGPPSDRIDGEVVIALDTEPGRAFGFQLRRDANLAARQRLLALLRDAFANDRPLLIEYLRTGRHNGTLIRASELPATAPAF